ncbi:MAG: 3',5'-cyclic AMP phosphodiesterase CpdA [Granulosicoccus sp.]|jgi:3',5'-cyclic AMP phosphodiesterase CpdA
MKPHDMPTVAVIADAHLHDMESDYDGASIAIDGRQLTLRSWADTRLSSRVFNESHMALMGALTDIVKREVKHVVLLGDYADDGQIEAIERVVSILRHFKNEHAVNFYAIPGNHDFYGPVGKHQSTRFAVSAQHTVLVTSDPETAEQESDSAVLTRKMFCLGAPDGLLPMADFGLFRQSEYLHWETPFGTSDAIETRRYPATSSDRLVTHQLMDASYLVEPSPGLWLLMIDANVFEPRNGTWNINQKRAFKDSSDAGWNSMLRNKHYLFEWITDVCKRADEQGKNLLTFSHYPALDPFNDSSGGYAKLFGQTEVIRRQPGIRVAEKLLETGLRLHFGGHIHVNSVSRYSVKNKQLTHISVPSPVSCPAAYQLIQTTQNEVHVDTISLASLALDPNLINFYKEENLSSQEPIDAALNASNYGDFLYKRIHSRVLHRYFKKDWPNEIVQNIDGTSVADLMVLFQCQETSDDPLLLCATDISDNTVVVTDLQALLAQHEMAFESCRQHSMMELIVDWYCLRDAGNQAQSFINPDSMKMYQFLSTLYGDSTIVEVKSAADFFSIFLGMMNTSLQALSQNLSPRETIKLSPRPD